MIRILGSLFFSLLFLFLSSKNFQSASPRVFSAKALLVSTVIWNSQFHCADAAAPPEQAAKLKDKIKNGRMLIEKLNDLLDEVKLKLKNKELVDKNVLEKVLDIKDKFLKLQVDPGDLSKDLLETFKEKTLEAFQLILQSYKLDTLPMIDQLQKTKNIQNPESNDLPWVKNKEL